MAEDTKTKITVRYILLFFMFAAFALGFIGIKWKSLVIMLIASLGLLLALSMALIRWKLMQRYWSRKCTGPEWARRYPRCSKDQIRGFLDILIASFGYKTKDRLKFSPQDGIMEIYDAEYPGGSPDACELDEFFDTLDKKYGIDPRTLQKEVTLGELFERAMKIKKTKDDYVITHVDPSRSVRE